MSAACWIAVLLTVQVVEKGEATFRPTPAEAGVPELFRLSESTFGFELEPVRETPRYSVAKLRFPSPIQTPDVANNTVHGEYFQPKGADKRPAVVVLHILGPTSPFLAITPPGWPIEVSRLCSSSCPIMVKGVRQVEKSVSCRTTSAARPSP